MRRWGSRTWVGVAGVACWTAAVAPVSAQDVCPPDPRRIVGGEPTDIKTHPWQVALDVEGSLCGGVLIGENWVLTAAHCFDSDKAEGVRAKAGATNFRVGGAWALVDRVVMHEKYDRKTNFNDLALVKLKSRAPGRSIPLAKADLVLKPCQTLEVTGWGLTQQGKGGASDVLQKVDVSYIDTAHCSHPRSYGGRILPGMMCAGQSLRRTPARETAAVRWYSRETRKARRFWSASCRGARGAASRSSTVSTPGCRPTATGSPRS